MAHPLDTVDNDSRGWTEQPRPARITEECMHESSARSVHRNPCAFRDHTPPRRPDRRPCGAAALHGDDTPGAQGTQSQAGPAARRSAPEEGDGAKLRGPLRRRRPQPRRRPY